MNSKKYIWKQILLGILLVLMFGLTAVFASSDLSLEVDTTTNSVDLDWSAFTLDKSEPHTFKVFQKKDGQNEFQSISATDLNKKVKVLNIFPNNPEVITSQITYTTWDGTKRTLPKSASAEMWMEQANPLHPKGYGMGLIDVTPLSIEAFNGNPEIHLKNTDGTWAYDVVFVGSWDNNAVRDTTPAGADLLGQFIDSGRGFLMGHDVTGYGWTGPISLKYPNFAKLLPKMNIEHLPGEYLGKHFNEIPSKFQIWWDNQIVLSKKGLLTSYPWEIGNLGDILDIPFSHTNWLITKGDRWMKFKDINNVNVTKRKEYTANENEEMNVYLSSWNNTAMIQTGHSNGDATHDEQMILANTLFYLAQLTNGTKLKDRSGMDVTPPTDIDDLSVKETEKELVVKVSPSTDRGSTYSYYIQSKGENTGKVAKTTIRTITNTSGFAGYSYIIDNKPDTIPDGIPETIKSNFTVDLKNHSGQYFHIAAVDKAGNISNVLHKKFQPLFLTGSVDYLNNAIDLKWNKANGMEPYSYQVYQQKEGSQEFQSISTSDIGKGNKIRVLNIYPVTAKIDRNDRTVIPVKEGSKRDLEGNILLESAALEEWIGNYGHGLIKVDAINQIDFDLNPDKHLMNSDGEYQYDVAVVGFWNIREEEEHLGDRGVEALREFTESGRGLMTGHHHLGMFQLDSGMNRLKDLFGVQFIAEKGWDHQTVHGKTTSEYLDYLAPEVSNNKNSSRYWHNSKQVIAQKRGLLLEYPNDVSDPGRILNIPESHNAGEFVTGDVWLSFYNPVAHNQTSLLSPTILPNGVQGAKDAYLSTHNNTAIIQTGHGNTMKTTDDEQKVIANTIFYLAQLTSETEVKDRSGMDTTAPGKPLNVNVNASPGKLNVQLKQPNDYGNTYKYYVEASNQNSDHKLKSNIIEIENKSGLAGYSYIVDNKSDTVPDGIPETTKEVFTVDLKDKGGSWFHISAVDKAGNVSEPIHIKFEVLFLTADVDYQNNAIDLNWNEMNGMEPYVYKVFQKKEGNDEFQSISISDLDSDKIIKALNVYPSVSIGSPGPGGYFIPDQVPQKLDLAGKPLKNSAMLESWIGEYGKGAIDVDAINQVDFDKYPDKYLKDSFGNYLYDVVAVGFWNLENGSEQHLGDIGVQALREFAESGRGLLTGHHHIGIWNLDKGMNQLKDLFGVKFVGEAGWRQSSYLDYIGPEKSQDGFSNSRYWHSGNKLKAIQKGLLLEYPNYVSEEGRSFDVPLTHNGGEFLTGDTWLEFLNPTAFGPNKIPSTIKVLPDGTTGSKNAYLSTYNNTAIIQTGHSVISSGGELISTEDEKKLIANTIFYLSQLTSETALKDRSGMDVKGPVFTGKSTYQYDNKTGSVIVTMPQTTDLGSTYTYYVEGTGQNSNDIFTSNQVQIANTSGVAGYSYLADNKPDTIPDNIVDTTSPIFTTTVEVGKSYLHIVAVDHAGNISEPIHFDFKNPSIDSYSFENITHDGYDIYVYGVMDEFSDVVSVQFPTWTEKNGQDDIKAYPIFPTRSVLEGENVGNGIWKYHINRKEHNGEFGNYMTHIYVYDTFGNLSVYHAPYELKDLVKPEISVKGNLSEWTNDYLLLTIHAVDSDTGIKSLILPGGVTVNVNGKEKELVTYPFKVLKNGVYTFGAVDDHGNQASTTVNVSRIDNTNPEIDIIEGNPTKWTNQSVTLYVKGRDNDSGIDFIENPDGSVVKDLETYFTVNENGNYLFTIFDKSGNYLETIVSVDYIDKNSPSQSTIKVFNK